MRTRRGNFRRGAIIAVAATVLLSLAAPAGAYHRQRYDELQDRIARKRQQIREAERREKDLLGKINESDARRATLERKVALLDDQLAAAQERLATLDARLDQITGQLARKNAQLEDALVRLDEQNTRLASRARTMYVRGPIDHSVVLFGAQSLNDAIVGREYARSALASDVTLLDAIKLTKSTIESARAEVQAKRAVVLEAQKEQAIETERVASLRAAQAGARSEVLDELAYRKNLLGKVRDEKAAYLKALDSYKRESADIADFLRGKQKGQTPVKGRGGWLKWPVSGRVTSEYGWRTHPVHGGRSFHTGIDIAAPHGRTIGAARSGEVVYTGYKGAFGLVAIIDHGSSVATMYSHLSSVHVRSGDRIRTGGAVGAIGCTGWCTGPHLHFEVRVGGEPQNPRSWL